MNDNYIDVEASVSTLEFVGIEHAASIVADAVSEIQRNNLLTDEQVKDFLKFDWELQKNHINDTYPKVSMNKCKRERLEYMIHTYGADTFADRTGIRFLCGEIARQLIFRYCICDNGAYMNSCESFETNTPLILKRDYKTYLASLNKEVSEVKYLADYEEFEGDDTISVKSYTFSSQDPITQYLNKVADESLKSRGIPSSCISYKEPFRLMLPLYLVEFVRTAVNSSDYDGSTDFMTSDEAKAYMKSLKGDAIRTGPFVLYLQLAYKKYDGISVSLVKKNIDLLIPLFLEELKTDIEGTLTGRTDLEERVMNA